MASLGDLPPGIPLIVLGVGILSAMGLMARAKMRRRELGVDLEKPGKREDVRESLDEIFVKLQEFSRESLSRLDTRIRMLNELLTRADAKIAELKKLQESRPAAPEAPAGKPANPLHEKIYRLADEGKTLLQITDATGLQRGEIELVLGLREKRA